MHDDTVPPVPALGDRGTPPFLSAPPAAAETASPPPAGVSAPVAADPSASIAEPEDQDQPPALVPAGPSEPAADSSAGKRPVEISVLGPLRITARGREIGSGMRKARELLAFLAVAGADGATAEAISEALWPGSPPGHGTNQRNIALRKARALLRRATGLATPMWITLSAERYRLDPTLIDTDLWQFHQALDAARAAPDDQARLPACQQAVGHYRGELAEGAGYEWAEPYAEIARRRALDAYTRIAEILKPTDPEQALAALETALTHDPYNEYTYQQIMRLQADAGRPDAVRRTLQLLETRLSELGITPGASTRQLAAFLLGASEPQTRL
jgi:DNA-binding SARP family transcriptional activator